MTTGPAAISRDGMSLAPGSSMKKKEEPQPDDTLEEAEAKSKSVDERIPPVLSPHDEIGPGERVLEDESKATRRQPRP